jgi:hypothetical protein
MKDVGGLSDGGPLDSDLQAEVLPIAGDVFSGKAISIFERDLIGERGRSKKQQDWHTQGLAIRLERDGWLARNTAPRL